LINADVSEEPVYSIFRIFIFIATWGSPSADKAAGE
jgi:hypothetical protein